MNIRLSLATIGAMVVLMGTAFGQDVETERSRPALLLGGDISALEKIEECGGVFRDHGEPGDAIRIMVGRGANCFRLRLFVDPTGENVVVNDLAYTARLAKRIKAAGARWMLDFHYSDTWADPGNQRKPKAWEDLDFESLEKTVYDYTRGCISELKSEDVLPDFVQIGNEITPGMLWPDGRLHGVGEPDAQWDHFARLLAAGARGVRDAARGKDCRIVIHVHCGGDWQKTNWFFENVGRRHVPYDVVGLSYYPWWHGTLDDLRENLRRTSETFDKDVFVVETAYPHRQWDVSNKRGQSDEPMVWPHTPAGQADFLDALVRTVRETPNRRGLGVLWWFPESIPVDNLRIWHGGATALFDHQGNALPAMSVFGD